MLGERRMANDNIYRYTIETIENYYPRIMKIKMANNLIRDGIATKNKKETDKIFVGDKEDYNRIAFCLEKDSRLIKYIENWEYEKYFKYSTYMQLSDGLDIKSIIEECLERNVISVFDPNGEPNELEKTIAHPIMKEDETYYYLKFVTQLETIDTTGKQRMKRNVALICISKLTKLIEVRFDVIETIFLVDREKYIKNLIAWIKTYIDRNATNLDLADIIEDIRDTYEKELNSVPELKKALDEFLYEKEELSIYPWITFLFKKYNFEVKFTMNYNGLGIDLLQHYSSTRQENVGKERMEHVTNYITSVGERIKI